MSSGLVVITDSELPNGTEERVLAGSGVDVVRAECRSAADVVAAGAQADALIVQWAPVDAWALERLPRLRMVSRLGIGTDMIDVAAATRHGIAVANTPDYCIDEVTAHTLALLLAFARRLVDYDRELRSGLWAPTAGDPPARRPADTTVAVIGLGRIGRRVAEGAHALGFRVLGCDPNVEPAAFAAHGAEQADLRRALAEADYVTLHLPLTDATRGLVGREALRAMKRDSVLINTCRGGLVDEAALIDALRDGTIAGAGLDVYGQEPLPEDSALRSLPNVLLTPHAAWFSPAALSDLPRRAAEQVADFLAGRHVPTILNPDYLEHRPKNGG